MTAVVFITLTLGFIFFYSGHIKDILLNELRTQVKEEVTIELKNIELTWVTHFPDISLELSELKIYQKIDNKQDTLISVKALGLGLDISELLQNDFTIEKIFIEDGFCSMKVFGKDNTNFKLLKTKKTSDSSSTEISFELESIHLSNLNYQFRNMSENDIYSVYFEKTTSNLVFEDNEWDISLEGPLSVENISVNQTEYVLHRNLDANFNLLYNPIEKSFKLDESSLKVNGGEFQLSGIYINNAKQHLDLNIKSSENKISNCLDN